MHKNIIVNQITIEKKIEKNPLDKKITNKNLAKAISPIKNVPKTQKKALPIKSKPQHKTIPTHKKNLSSILTNKEKLVEKLKIQKINFDNPDISKALEIKKKELIIPKEIELKIDSSKIDDNKHLSKNPLIKELNYKQLIVSELQNNLNLPEYGEVKVSFTIEENGHISDIKILEYQSEKNQNYLKNSLSSLSFKDIDKTIKCPISFIVTFKNL